MWFIRPNFINLDEIYEKVFENPEGGFNKGFAFISKRFIGF